MRKDKMMKMMKRSAHRSNAARPEAASVGSTPGSDSLFGYMFPHMTQSPWTPKGNPNKLEDEVLKIANKMIDSGNGGSNLENPSIPAGYTFFGQFVDHDITFDTTSSLERDIDDEIIENFRTPRFDLDSIYGLGLESSPYLFHPHAEGKLMVGSNGVDDDLLRISGTNVAVIGDPRNDENLLISQMQLAIIKIHNKMVDHVHADDPTLTGKQVFEKARDLVRWHYQYVVINDFTKRVIGDTMLNSIYANGQASLQHFSFSNNRPFMPFEFSVAAYRFGHSMVNPSFIINANTPTAIPFFDPTADSDVLADCSGFRSLPPGGTVDWTQFFEMGGSSPQLSHKIDETLASGLGTLPFEDQMNAINKNLAARNILRGVRLKLPSGQDVAKEMGVTALNIPGGGNPKNGDPLWQYILHEADQQHNGEHLGEVGGRLVGEVLVGLLIADPHSYHRVDASWKPSSEGIIPQEGTDFELRDLLAWVM